ncbi:MAG: glycosyltransferase [Sphingobium sp.]
MDDALIGAMAVAYHEILLFAAIGLLIGGIDDLIVDMVFLARSGWRHLTIYKRHPRMTTATLPPSPSPGRIAIFVPAWREADVIAAMLRHATSAWGQSDYCLFVGTYPNDRRTIDAVTTVAMEQSRVLLAVNHRDGPTTKADCLNILWRAMLTEEERTGRPFKAVVLHDAEDVVHADELRVFDLLIDRFDLIQLPVLPLPGTGGWWARAIAGHYGDEFAEALRSKALLLVSWLQICRSSV